ncbi:hypothetical protein CYY_010032 [Polysphondylium violaceum]|uniref:Transmembrane protein n=1 Tax=Polysphondylium violaceum TaxID=133409 RepID=A0A8J4UP25_9MYCE|nr:hypothetical protein CYY_010032 [Polysphondylium violaceum]
MEKTIDFLEECDLQPKYVEEKKGKNPIAGLITILYLPLLFVYLWYSIQPQYGALPSCCACANFNTPKSNWIFLANDPKCSSDPKCKAYVQNKLKFNCDATLMYLPVPDVNLTMNIEDIGCLGLKPGDTCDSDCLAVSNRWVTSLDYTSQDNRDQAQIRCPLQIGACDFKAIYSVQEKTPHAVCRYPELNGILTKLGAGLGLLNGILITFRIMLRTFWDRIGKKSTTSGGLKDYWKGVLIGMTFNYFGILYLSLADNISKRMRFGGQLAVGFLIIFFKSPFVVYLIIIFSSFWTPIAILWMLGCIGVAIILRTTFNLLLLEIHSRNCVVLSQGGMDQFEINHDGDQDMNTHSSTRVYIDNPMRNYQLPRRIKPVPYTNWTDFFTGFFMNIFALYYLWTGSYRRYTGMKSGFYCSISVLTITVVWGLLFGLKGWRYITFNFPFPLQETNGDHIPKEINGSGSLVASSNSNGDNVYLMSSDSFSSVSGSSSDDSYEVISSKDLIQKAFLQSIYSTLTWTLILASVYHFSLFLKYLPDSKIFRLRVLPKKPQGAKMDFKFGFILSMIPLFITFFFFFYFKFIPYVNSPLPDSPLQCKFAGWTLIIPILGIIPSFILMIFSVSERFRSGVLSSIGVSLLIIGMGSSILLFNYCIGPTQNRYYPISYLVSLIGTFIILYGSIRSNTILVLDKKKENPQFLEEERLLQNNNELNIKNNNDNNNNNNINNNNINNHNNLLNDHFDDYQDSHQSHIYDKPIDN